MYNHFITKITEIKKNNLYRKLKNFDASHDGYLINNNKKYVSFACNDYLDLSQNSTVKNQAILAIKKYGVGSRGSRYITGNSNLYNKLEKKLAKFYGFKDAVIFSSGYSCAIGTIKALVDNHDLIIADKLIHACLIDGSILSQAKFLRFNHNDIEHCQKILEENRVNYKKCLIITESIFSMDGDEGKIDDLLKLAHKYQAYLLIDNAHGILNQFKFDDKVIIMGTLSKAFGGLGGYVVANNLIIEYLKQVSRSLIYSTALPPSLLASSLTALALMKNQKLAKKSIANAEFFCDLMNLPIPKSAIVIIKIFDDKKTLLIANKILKNGYIVGAIRYPTVPKNQSRLRLTFNAKHKKQDIKNLANIIKKILVIKK